MPDRVYLAIDLGAESGRVMAGLWNGKTIRLEEIHRFPNGPVYLGDSLRWDVVRLWAEIQNGLALAAKKYGKSIVSVGADTWGVDYVLLDQARRNAGPALRLPRRPHQRDDGEGLQESAARGNLRPDRPAVHAVQHAVPVARARSRRTPELLEAADCLLFMPDFIHWALCGSRVAEFTIASTSQCLNPLTRNWATGLLKKFGLPTRIFPKVVPPGTQLGALRPGVAERTGLRKVKVVAPPSARHRLRRRRRSHRQHRQGQLGLHQLRHLVADGRGGQEGLPVRAHAGAEPDQRRRPGRHLSPAQEHHGPVARAAVQARLRRRAAGNTNTPSSRKWPPRPRRCAPSSIPTTPRFLNPPDMPKAIQDFCRETRQPVPKTEGELVRCAYESLALKYREVLGWLEELTGNRIEVIHIVGGGSKSAILNQFTADACQRPVSPAPSRPPPWATCSSRSARAASCPPWPRCARSSASPATWPPASPPHPAPGTKPRPASPS